MRRFLFTRRSVIRCLLALGLAASLLTAGGSWAQLTRVRRQVETARGETRALQADQARLRESAFELAGRLIQSVEASVPADSEYQPRLSVPAHHADNALVLAWLVAQCAPLEQLADDVVTTNREHQAAFTRADTRLLPAQRSFLDDFVVR